MPRRQRPPQTREMGDPAIPLSGLNLGCGDDWRPVRDGWINLDLHTRQHPDVVADVRSLPFQNDRFTTILAHDILEHLGRTETDAVLAEWARVLAPDGIISIRVPSFHHLAARALNGGGDLDADYSVIWLAYGTQSIRGDYHLTSFTPALLRWYLERAGLHVWTVGMLDEWMYEITARRLPPAIPPVWPQPELPAVQRAVDAAVKRYERSTSWRATAPLRCGSQAIRRLSARLAHLLGRS
jgi:SAM-dependent methyltransferase